MQADFVLARGDLLPAIQRTLVGFALSSLAGCTVAFEMRPRGSAAPLLNAPASIVDATNLIVAYAWQAGDTDVSGWFYGQFVVTIPDGRVQRFPRPGYLSILIDKTVADV